MARLGAGAIAGGSMMIGRGSQAGVAVEAMQPSPYPPPGTGTYSEHLNTIPRDHLYQARYKAAEPLRKKLEELQCGQRWQLSDNMHTENSSYLPALKSTAPWWRASVMQDKRKRRQTAIESLQEQANKLMEAPLEKMESLVNDMLANFIAELGK